MRREDGVGRAQPLVQVKIIIMIIVIINAKARAHKKVRGVKAQLSKVVRDNDDELPPTIKKSGRDMGGEDSARNLIAKGRRGKEPEGGRKGMAVDEFEIRQGRL